MEKSQTAYKLLELLADGKFHSGETLGHILGITRSAIWKAVKQLSTYNIQVESVTGKGYRIPHGMELLNRKQIENQVAPNARKDIDQLIILNSIDSTNDYLLSLIKSEPDKKIACFAEYQNKARGRRGRHWVAPFGTNVSLSLLWYFHKDPAEIVGLSLAIAVGTLSALQKYGIQEGLSLKWPNDILWQGRKLSGVLLEMVAEHHERCAVVIGVGINIHIPNQIANQIDQPWIDIQAITQQTPQRNVLAGLLLNELIYTVQLFAEQGLTPFIPTWRKFDRLIGKTVKLESPNKNVIGVMQDISDKGELILCDSNNEEKRFLSGELSLRMVKYGD